MLGAKTGPEPRFFRSLGVHPNQDVLNDGFGI